MMVESERRTVESASHLPNFPCKDFGDFTRSFFVGEVQLQVDLAVARNWAFDGLYSSLIVRIFALFLYYVPHIVWILFTGYLLYYKRWIWLLTLPSVPILMFALDPRMYRLARIITVIPLLSSIFFGAWGFILGNYWLLAFCSATLATWYSLKRLYEFSINALLAAIVSHEDLLCLFWKHNLIGIRFTNGDEYRVNQR
jgi:hypothetical protein